jgi:nicotinamide mononucleotide transporter
VTPASAIELAAVALALGYLVLAIREHPACWFAGAASALLYGVLLTDAKLYFEAALQVVYVTLAGYGYQQWRAGRAGSPLPVTRMPVRWHAPLLAAVALATLVAGFALARLTDAAWPYVDPAIAFGSLAATWLTARKWLENWLYWFVIDAASVLVYLERGLYPTAALFALYLVLIAVGYRQWQGSLRAAVQP